MAAYQVLSDVSQGMEVSLIDFYINPEDTQRLAELGVFEGMRVAVISNSTKYSPLIIAHRGSKVVLSRQIARNIEIYQEM